MLLMTALTAASLVILAFALVLPLAASEDLMRDARDENA